MNLPIGQRLFSTAAAVVAGWSLAAPLAVTAVEPAATDGSDSFIVLPDTTSPDAVIDFTLEPSGTALAAKVSEVRAAENASGAVSGSSEDALSKADADLNRAYSAFRKRLGETEAETLKVEQRAWLKKRDKIKDPAAKAAFVAERAKALEARTR